MILTVLNILEMLNVMRIFVSCFEKVQWFYHYSKGFIDKLYTFRLILTGLNVLKVGNFMRIALFTSLSLFVTSLSFLCDFSSQVCVFFYRIFLTLSEFWNIFSLVCHFLWHFFSNLYLFFFFTSLSFFVTSLWLFFTSLWFLFH